MPIYALTYKNELKSSYDDLTSAVEDFFLPMKSKYCNTDGRSVWTVRGTMLKNKFHSVAPQESILVSLWTFQPTPRMYVCQWHNSCRRLPRPIIMSLWDNFWDERGCDKGHWHAHTRGLWWALPEVVGTVQVHCSRRRLLRRGLQFHVCTINKSAHTKKVWKLIVCTSYISIYKERGEINYGPTLNSSWTIRWKVMVNEPV